MTKKDKESEQQNKKSFRRSNKIIGARKAAIYTPPGRERTKNNNKTKTSKSPSPLPRASQHLEKIQKNLFRVFSLFGLFILILKSFNQSHLKSHSSSLFFSSLHILLDTIRIVIAPRRKFVFC